MTLAVFVGAVSVSAYHRAKARRGSETISRRRESGPLVMLRLLVSLPLLGSILMYIIAPGRMNWASFPAPEWLQWLGIALGIASVLSAQWVLGSLGRNVSETVLTKSQHELVTSGPYRWIRHPLYTTGGLLLTSIGLMTASWLVLSFVLLAMLLIRIVVIPLEERALLEKFGSAYQAYMGQTGRLLPRL